MGQDGIEHTPGAQLDGRKKQKGIEARPGIRDAFLVQLDQGYL